MSRRFVTQLREGESIDEVFLATDKQLRSNRNGNLYLQIRLTDKTGTLTAMLWNANENIANTFERGDYVRVQGATQVYNGALQMIANRVDRVKSDTVNEDDFITLGEKAVGRLTQRVADLLRGMSDVALRNLADCFLMDETLMDQFQRAPAGIRHHHAYQGGLLEHVVSVMELAALTAPRYPHMNADLLLFGAFLHDIGKIRELNYDRELGYSDEGQLLGHLTIGLQILDEKVAEAEKLSGDRIPAETVFRLKHMILSHHGQYEFGSPKVPMTLEALALHYLDGLDSKMHAFQQLMDEDINDEPWTTYHPNIGRKLFKGGAASADSDG